MIARGLRGPRTAARGEHLLGVAARVRKLSRTGIEALSLERLQQDFLPEDRRPELQRAGLVVAIEDEPLGNLAPFGRRHRPDLDRPKDVHAGAFDLENARRLAEGENDAAGVGLAAAVVGVGDLEARFVPTLEVRAERRTKPVPLAKRPEFVPEGRALTRRRKGVVDALLLLRHQGRDVVEPLLLFLRQRGGRHRFVAGRVFAEDAARKTARAEEAREEKDDTDRSRYSHSSLDIAS